MSTKWEQSGDGKRTELFIGLVGATGSNLKSVQGQIKNILSQFNYKVETLKFSDFLEDENFIQILNLSPEESNKLKVDKSSNRFDEISSQMTLGTQARRKRGSLLSEYAVIQIQEKREEIKEHLGDRNKSESKEHLSTGVAYIFDSIKHPDESKLLSRTYGDAYYQIGVFSSKSQRISFLINKEGIKKEDAYILTERDISEEDPKGQQTRGAFELSDIFVSHSYEDEFSTKIQLERIFDLMFGHPYITPTIDEHMMYIAYAYSTRTADLSRQVGAVVASERGNILGLGSNDVPRFGGGPYWPSVIKKGGVHDWRDYRREKDPNQEKREKIGQIIEKAIKDEVKEISSEKMKDIFRKSGLFDITEFARATHAEMAAILSCARNGVSPVGKTLYCTTFPCHNCAKHIVESGIKEVLFVEPYPKSFSEELHGDAIFVSGGSTEGNEGKVAFKHFIGVAAKRYLDLFSMKLGRGEDIKRKGADGKVVSFMRKNQEVRVRVNTQQYFEKEIFINAEIKKGFDA